MSNNPFPPPHGGVGTSMLLMGLGLALYPFAPTYRWLIGCRSGGR